MSDVPEPESVKNHRLRRRRQAEKCIADLRQARMTLAEHEQGCNQAEAEVTKLERELDEMLKGERR